VTELPKPDVSGICPHCGYKVVFIQPTLYEGRDESEEKLEYFYTGHDGIYKLIGSKCPNSDCKRFILVRQMYINHNPGVSQLGYASGSLPSPEPKWEDDILIWPRGIARHAPKDVPKEIAKLYEEAYKVLNLSEAAVAVLVRRCLEDIIHDKTQQKEWRLGDGIKTIEPDLPDQLKGKPTLVRILGKIGSHSKKDAKTGEIIEVDREEAEFILDFIEQLFDHYYVQPAKDQEFQNRITTKYSRINQSKKRPTNKKAVIGRRMRRPYFDCVSCDLDTRARSSNSRMSGFMNISSIGIRASAFRKSSALTSSDKRLLITM